MSGFFTIAPDRPFLETLAQRLWDDTKGDRLSLSRYRILLPTRRACRFLGEAFARIGNGKPVLLPRMQPLGDVDEDEFSFLDLAPFDIPPAMPPLDRLMALARLVRQADQTLSWDQAALAAQALARFLDDVAIEQVDLNDLPALVSQDNLAEHWKKILDFLNILTTHWPAILKESGCIDPAARRNALMNAQAEAWQRNPPDFPILAAGSTGSMPSTAALLTAIATFPLGTVVLPGLDRAMDDSSWEALDETHPQYTMKRLLLRAQINRRDVQDFVSSPPSARTALLREAFRPAAVSDAWQDLKGAWTPAVAAGLERVTLDTPQEEAMVLALRLRRVLENPSQTAALVTADRGLAARVAAILKRWGVAIDDSGGTTLLTVPPGAFLHLVLAAAEPDAGANDLLALLKHPLAACGQAPSQCRAMAREAELLLRRDDQDSFAPLRQRLEPLAKDWGTPLPLASWITRHQDVALALAASDTENGSQRLFTGEWGERLASWLDEWREAAAMLPPLSGHDYAALFDTMAATVTLRSVRTSHPRISLLGPLEARLGSFDVVLLGGLNEGSWPMDIGFDPWMSRPMRRAFGMTAPEYRIGLSAHDFVHMVSSKEVFLTRAARVDGTPSIPSRFLLQLDTVLRAAGLFPDDGDALAPSKPWRAWAADLDRPCRLAPCPRPAPCPPVNRRPDVLAVTDIATWLRNPYALYAKRILKLKKLDALDQPLDRADRGTMIHKIFETFVQAFPKVLPDDAEEQLRRIAQNVFHDDRGDPRVRVLWEAQFDAAVPWFLEKERERRSSGLVPVGTEVKGRIVLDGLTLKGIADRFDRFPDGALALVDYKTGEVPSVAVKSGLEPQLALLALIARHGGFESLPAAEVLSVAYWKIGSRKDACKETIFDEVEALVADAEKRVKRLIALFAKPSTPYTVLPKPDLRPRYGDYDHLSRLGEWNFSDGGS
ncbi:MAG: PD-(D/E)XK nuclease family protein [Alphaproteobacteria bacterium]|nr:PD-(D/E)XK nuclease family protein [Alphaproteobacteria bacterium]